MGEKILSVYVCNWAIQDSAGEEMAVGDDMLVDGMSGVIIFGFAKRMFADGYLLQNIDPSNRLG